MIEYVAGFLFNTAHRNVALVRKNKPTWQAGKLNGIGGKVEPGEYPAQAMAREFKEETGAIIDEFTWYQFATLYGPDSQEDHISRKGAFCVHFFSAFITDKKQHLANIVSTQEDEEIVVLPINAINLDNAIPNLTWLIPMAFSLSKDKTASSFKIHEVAVV